MQKTNNLLGVIGAILFTCGVLFRHFQWPGGSVILGLGFLLFVAFFVIFLISGLKSLSGGLEKASGTSVAITMLIIVTGFYFKTQHWPGANVAIIVAFIGLLISGIILVIKNLGLENPL